MVESNQKSIAAVSESHLSEEVVAEMQEKLFQVASTFKEKSKALKQQMKEEGRIRARLYRQKGVEERQEGEEEAEREKKRQRV